jgi:hypothetical protein
MRLIFARVCLGNSILKYAEIPADVVARDMVLEDLGRVMPEIWSVLITIRNTL